jgi:hypothetical protein
MNTTRSVDGELRATVRVSYRVSVDHIVGLAFEDMDSFRRDERMADRVSAYGDSKAFTKTNLEGMLRDALWSRGQTGLDFPQGYQPDPDSVEYKTMRRKVLRLFPEFEEQSPWS